MKTVILALSTLLIGAQVYAGQFSCTIVDKRVDLKLSGGIDPAQLGLMSLDEGSKVTYNKTETVDVKSADLKTENIKQQWSDRDEFKLGLLWNNEAPGAQGQDIAASITIVLRAKKSSQNTYEGSVDIFKTVSAPNTKKPTEVNLTKIPVTCSFEI